MLPSTEIPLEICQEYWHSLSRTLLNRNLEGRNCNIRVFSFSYRYIRQYYRFKKKFNNKNNYPDTLKF